MYFSVDEVPNLSMVLAVGSSSSKWGLPGKLSEMVGVYITNRRGVCKRLHRHWLFSEEPVCYSCILCPTEKASFPHAIIHEVTGDSPSSRISRLQCTDWLVR